MEALNDLKTESVEDDYDGSDCDLAINHACNAELRPQEKVRRFFTRVQRLKSLADLETLEWLAAFPMDMYDDVIPLFDDDASSTGYQLHPSFTNLTLGDRAEDPHSDVFCLSADGQKALPNTPDGPQLIMGIGRLFVNVRGGDNGYLSKWTGYEVFVDYEMGLWMVFDSRSRMHNHGGLYEFDCGLVKPKLKPHNETTFGYARFCYSLCDIETTSFNDSRAMVERTKKPGNIGVSQVERKELYDTIQIRKSLIHPVSKDLDTFLGYLSTNFQNKSIIESNMTNEAFTYAAANLTGGFHIMHMLLEICQGNPNHIGFSQGAIEGAAKNHVFGADITEMLVDHNLYAFSRSISKKAVAYAAMNKEKGKRILSIFLRAGGVAVEKHIKTILNEKGDGYAKDAINGLRYHLQETRPDLVT
ncbi:hypothetical protein F5Y10DRAFT_256530 [Nemania abortiva]|nr:hypothetical protein F5Y10DRAFT_256530 [Nemania abortiva]